MGGGGPDVYQSSNYKPTDNYLNNMLMNYGGGQLSAKTAPQVYNPQTGQMEAQSGNNPAQLTGENVLSQEGGFLNDKYAPTSYNATPTYGQQSYSPTDFNYETGATPVAGITPISNDIYNNDYQRQADTINKGYSANQTNLNSTIANAGGSLSGGRAMRMQSDVDQQHTADLGTAQGAVSSQQAQQNYGEAQHQRDVQAQQNEQNLTSQGNLTAQQQQAMNAERENESQFGQTQATQQNAAANAEKEAENQYGFQAGQQQGTEKLNAFNAANAQQEGLSTGELAAERGMSAEQVGALQNMLNLYLGQQQTAVNEANGQSSALGGMLGGIAQGAGSMAGSVASSLLA